MQKDLRDAVTKGLNQGIAREQLRTLLKQGGWRHEEVEEALASFVETDAPIAIPVRAPVRFAKESYLYLMQTVSYVVTAIAFLILWFQYLNIWLPDTINTYSYSYDGARSLIRTGLSMLIVSLPVLLLVSHSIRRDETMNIDAPRNATKQGVLYLGAFIASICAAITLMVTIYTGLSGEATTRFLLKVVAVLAVCGTTGWLARFELRQESSRRKTN